MISVDIISYLFYLVFVQFQLYIEVTTSKIIFERGFHYQTKYLLGLAER